MALRSFDLGEIDEVGRRVHVLASTRDPVKGAEVDVKTGASKPRLEALDSWDLTRYSKNNPVLWQHEGYAGPIGWGEEVRETDRGLEMWIRFAPASTGAAGVAAEEAWAQVKARLIKGVSVGFEFGERKDETRGDEQVAVFRNNSLNEVSLVSIPADPNALVSARSDAAETVRRFDYGRLGVARRTAVGGVIAPARLTRTGVLEYRTSDGKIRRELRTPEEVFHQDSLDSLRNVPVTDLEHHRAFIDTSNFKEASLGHATDIRHDGKYVEGDLHINEARTVVEVENKRLVDVSCGYQCKLDFSPGEWNGERYDAIQRSIRYNHVAVLPPGRGRAGTDVGIRLDSTDAVCVEEEQIMKVIKLDGKDVEYGSDQHIGWLESDCARQVKAANAERDAASAKFDAGEKAAKKSAEDKKAEEEKSEKERAAAFKRRLRLTRTALRYMEDEDGEDEEKKSDALDDLSDRELMISVIRTDADHKDFDGAGKSDDYVQAFYDMRIKKPVERADGVDSVVRAVERAKRADSRDSDPENEARLAMQKRNAERWKQPVGMSR